MMDQLELRLSFYHSLMNSVLTFNFPPILESANLFIDFSYLAINLHLIALFLVHRCQSLIIICLSLLKDSYFFYQAFLTLLIISACLDSQSSLPSIVKFIIVNNYNLCRLLEIFLEILNWLGHFLQSIIYCSYLYLL
jgi:hypothetical protein